MGKLIALRQDLQREAARRRRRDPGPAPPFIKPCLWIITAGRPSLGIDMLGAVPDDAWPRGVYLTPALEAGRRRPGTRGVPGGMRVGFVVAGELPRERETILVRLMAGGAALSAAVADLAGLPADAYERVVASAEVVELRQMLGQKSRKTKKEEAFIVNTRDAFEQLKEEGRREGRDEGLAQANARAVLTVLRVRGIPVPDATRERILAERDPARLARWLERAILAASVAEVLGEPS
ncbi:MAG: hypothetical protein QM820_54550 [Minicystis sp.]